MNTDAEAQSIAIILFTAVVGAGLIFGEAEYLFSRWWYNHKKRQEIGWYEECKRKNMDPDSSKRL